MVELTGMSSTHDSDEPATGAGSLADAARIAWQRARSFNFLQPGAPTRAGTVIAPWLWPLELIGVAREAPRIRRLGGASMTLTGGGTRGRTDPVVFAAAVATYLVFVVVLIVVASSTAIALPRFTGLGVDAAIVLSLVVFLAPLLTEVTRRITHVLQHPENRTITSRRRRLARTTGQPVLIMTAFVRTRRGEGAALLAALRREWDQDQITVILNPANKELVDYYMRHGAVVDANWRRLMIPPGQVARPTAENLAN